MKDKDCNHIVGFDYLGGISDEKAEWILYSEVLNSPTWLPLVPISQFFIFCPWCGVKVKSLPGIKKVLLQIERG